MPKSKTDTLYNYQFTLSAIKLYYSHWWRFINLIMQICEHVQGLYLLEVTLNGYENRDGRCIDCPQRSIIHSCYDDFGRFDDWNLSYLACDSYFVFCLRIFNTRWGRFNCQENYKGTRVTSANINDAPLDYTNKTVLGLENPFLLPGLTEDYKVSSYVPGSITV